MQYDVIPFREFSARLIPRLMENFQRISLAINSNSSTIRAVTTPNGGRVFHNANVSVPNNAWTALPFNSQHYIAGVSHSVSVNNSRITIDVSGQYVIGGCVAFAPHATGQRGVGIRRNGNDFLAIALCDRASVGETFLNASTVVSLTQGEFLEMVAFQNSGGALNVNRLVNYSPEFWCSRIF